MTIWGSDFGLLCSGLFNFYQFASFEVKEHFLDLMENYLLKLEDELHICLSGFLVCILPGIDDQNEQTARRVERILVKTEEIVGTRIFYGSIWMALLRSPRTRMGGLKFIERKIPKTIDQAKTTRIFPIRTIVTMSSQNV